MLLLKQFRRWIRALFQKTRFEHELDSELRFHVESMIDANIRAGMRPDEARRAAQLEFGGREKTKEECRDARALHLFEELWRDVCHGGRMMRRSPGFTATVVLTLALAILANTAIFSIVSAVLLQPLPFVEPDRLVRIQGGMHLYDWPAGTSSPDLPLKEPIEALSRIAGYDGFETNLNDDRAPARIRTLRVSAGFFPMLGVQPWRGRLPAAEDFNPGTRVLVLGYELWRNHFNSDPRALNATVRLNGDPFTIIGIMPGGFRFHFWHGEADAYCTLYPGVIFNDRAVQGTIARLKAGVSLSQAQAQVDAVFQRTIYRGQDVAAPNFRKFGVIPLSEDYEGDLKKPLLILSGAVAFVLLIACLNVANLLLARSVSRQRESAIRSAIGCSRLRLIRQHLIESSMLSFAGGALGLLLTKWVVDAVVLIIPVYVPRVYNIGIDGRVLCFTLAVTLITGLVFGTAPAWRFSKPNTNEMLKQGGLGVGITQSSRLRSFLMVAEIALALVLMAGSGLLIKSLANFLSINLGFNPKNVLTMELGPMALKGAELPRQEAYYRRVLKSVRAMPGVQFAAIADQLPVTSTSRLASIKAMSDVPDGPDSSASNKAGFEGSYCKVVGDDYFQSLQIPLLAGRYFTDQDGPRSPCVMILDLAQASKLFPDKNAVGRQLLLARKEPTACQIVGVVADVHHWGISRTPDPPLVYLPASQAALPNARLIVRTSGNPMAAVASLSAEIHRVDPDLPLYDLKTLEKYLDEKYSSRTFPTILLGCFAVLALLLATVGVYSVMSYLVGQRKREIGIRMALGAQKAQILRLFLKYGFSTALEGVIIGLCAGFALTRFLSSLLFEIRAADPTTFAGAALLLLAVALSACYWPARTAAAVDPMAILRHE